MNTEKKWMYDFKHGALKFYLLQPTRKMRKEAELFYSKTLNDYVMAGIRPRSIWAKMFKENGGFVSKEETERYEELIREIAEHEIELHREDITDEEKETVNKKLLGVRRSINQLELSNISAYQNSAEYKAREELVTWWIVTLSHFDRDGKIVEVAPGRNYEERLEKYDEVESADDEDLLEGLRKLIYLITVWSLGGAQSREEFDRTLKENESTIKDLYKEEPKEPENSESDEQAPEATSEPVEKPVEKPAESAS